MPRFFFDVREGARFLRDDTGLSFESAEAAEWEAAKAAAEMARDQLPKGAPREITVEVRDEKDQSIADVTVSMRIRRMRALIAEPAEQAAH